MPKLPIFAAITTVAIATAAFLGSAPALADDDSTPTISGYVYSTDGTPLSGIEVEIIQYDTFDAENPWPTFSGDAITNSSGQYTLSGYSGFSGSLEFYDTSHTYATAYLGGAQFLSDATPFDDTNATGPVSAPDMTMQPGGTISSIVTKPDGTQDTDFTLSVYAMDTSDAWELVLRKVITPMGSFPWSQSGDVWQSPAVAPGDYRLCESNGDAEDQCEGDTATPGTSTPIQVTAGSTTEADFALDEGNTLAGTVESADGTPVTYLILWWLNPDTNLWENLGLISNSSGGWEVKNLRPGMYQLLLPGDLAESVYYPDPATLDPDGTIDVIAGQVNPPVTISMNPLPTAQVTTTSLTLSASSEPYGSSGEVTATATVVIPGSTTVPDGSVTIYDFGPSGTVFTVPLVAGSASVTLPSSLDVGTQEVEASFAGSETEGFAPSQSARVPLVIVPLPVDVGVSVSAPSKMYGASAAVTATIRVSVVGTSAIPDGSVNVDIDGLVYRPGAYATFNSTTGVASIQLPADLAVGVHQISAQYVPDPAGDYVQSEASSATFTVAPAPAKLSMKARISWIRGHRTVTLDAAVVQPGSHPAGTVLVYYRGRLVASGWITRSGASGSVILYWRKPWTQSSEYVVRFASEVRQPMLSGEISLR